MVSFLPWHRAAGASRRAARFMLVFAVGAGTVMGTAQAFVAPRSISPPPPGAFRFLTHTTRWITDGRGILSVQPGDAPDVWAVDIHLERGTSDGPRKSGTCYARLPVPLVSDLVQRPRQLSGQIRVPRGLIGDGKEEYLTPMRARWVMRDLYGRRCFGPNTAVSLLPGRWVTIAPLLPTALAPMAKGLMEEGFDPTRVAEIGLNLEAGNVPQGPEIHRPVQMTYRGVVQLRCIQLEPVRAASSPAESAPAPLYPAPADEAAAAPALWQRLRQRLQLREGEMAVMVNMAWPFRSGRYHVYGTALGVAPWGAHWGFSSSQTAAAVRQDLRYLKAHGIRVVRLFLFGDLRTGLVYDQAGRPTGFQPMVYADMTVLLRIFREEQMLMIPSLVDFLVVDGVTREGPRLAWAVGERPDLLTQPEARRALVNLLAQFVADFDGPEVLMWELMNEPDNAVAVATPEHFNSMRRFVAALAARLHAQGVVTTLGARHVGDYHRFWRGMVDVSQVHHWRLLESVPNPYPLDTPARELGPLPAMVGEIEPVAASDVGPLLDRLRDAGYLLAGFWSLRGHDGYAYQPIADAVQEWLARQTS